MYDVVVILVLNKSIEQRPQVRVAFGYASQRGNTWITALLGSISKGFRLKLEIDFNREFA